MKSFNTPLHLLLANALYAQCTYFGGASLNKYFKGPKTGYNVAILAGPVYNNLSAVNEHEVSDWIKFFIVDQPTEEDNLLFGSWKDTETGKVYFDLSYNYLTKEIALSFATQHNQIAIWDVENNCEIRL